MKALDYIRSPTLWYRGENIDKRGKVACPGSNSDKQCQD